MNDVTDRVRTYWDQASCGTNRTEKNKFSLEYFEEIEEFRYRHEPYIHSFAQFTRWHGQKVLEIGIGAGTDFLQFVRAGACAHGVDLTQESVENVSNRLRVYCLEAKDLRVCNAEQLPYESGFFDLVYSWGVIHHAENMEKVFAEIYRVTRPGGRIKIMIYNLNSIYAWYRFVRHALPRGHLFDGRRWAIYHFQESFATKAYTAREIRNLLGQYAHSDLRFYYWEQRIRDGARCELLRRFLQRIMPRRMRWYLAFEFTKPVAESGNCSSSMPTKNPAR